MGTSIFQSVHANSFNNYNEAVEYFAKSKECDDGSSRDRRISMTCTEQRYNQITSRSGNNSRLLEMAYRLMESFIGTEGPINCNHVVLLEVIRVNAGKIMEYLNTSQEFNQPELKDAIEICRGLKID